MSPSPMVEGFFDPATHTVSYLIHDPTTRRAAVIDPVLDYAPANARTATRSADRILERIAEQELALEWLLETHVHADHLSAGYYLRERSGAALVIGAGIVGVQGLFAPLFGTHDVTADGRPFDRLVEDGEQLPLGDLTIEVLHTPGHTPACVSYRIGDAVFVGDTLFMPDYGTARCDFPGGDARTLHASIRRILGLPDATRLFVGHDYLPEGRTSYCWQTSVAAQRSENIHVRDTIGVEEFVAMREARDARLDAPALILPALQVNIRGGDLPPPDPDGRRYLKLPLDTL